MPHQHPHSAIVQCIKSSLYFLSVKHLCVKNFWPPSAFETVLQGFNQVIFICTTAWRTEVSVVQTIQPYESEEAQQGSIVALQTVSQSHFLDLQGKARHPVVAESHQALIQVYNIHEKSNLRTTHLSTLEPPS